MDIKQEIVIEKPIEEVWDILGNQYGEAYKWATSLKHSQSYGTPKIGDAHCNNRACDTTSGKIKEKINVFDAKNHILEYEVIEGFPFFVERGVNNWSLTQQSQSSTKVQMRLNIETKGLFGAFMGPMMKLKMSDLTSDVICDLKQYLETGKPSKRKQKEIKKLSKKAA